MPTAPPKNTWCDSPTNTWISAARRIWIGLSPTPEFPRRMPSSFLKVVAREFDLSITAGDCGGVNTLRDMVALMDAHAG